jgi:hypothetical protein
MLNEMTASGKCPMAYKEEIRLPSWWLPMAYIQPAANTHTQITSRGRGKGNILQSEYLILIRLPTEQTGITGNYF